MLTIYLFVPITVLGAWIIPLTVQVYEERETDCFGKPGHGYYRCTHLCKKQEDCYNTILVEPECFSSRCAVHRVAILSLFLVFLVQLGTMLLAFAASLRGDSHP